MGLRIHEAEKEDFLVPNKNQDADVGNVVPRN